MPVVTRSKSNICKPAVSSNLEAMSKHDTAVQSNDTCSQSDTATVSEPSAKKIDPVYYTRFKILYARFEIAVSFIEKCKVLLEFYKFVNENYSQSNEYIPYCQYLQTAPQLKKTFLKKTIEFFNVINSRLITDQFDTTDFEILRACCNELAKYIQLENNY